MLQITEVADKLGLAPSDIRLYGSYVAKIEASPACEGQKAVGHLINVTAMTPTKFGEGKTTVTIGLLDAFRKLGKKASAAIRQSSMGPTFNIKGAGIGGGLSSCVPRDALALGLTGDMDRVMHAQNLAMVTASQVPLFS